MANSERMINWLGSCKIQGIEGNKRNTTVNVPFGIDKHSGDVSHIRLSKKETSGRWFIYTTCIGALGLPVTVGKNIQARNDI